MLDDSAFDMEKPGSSQGFTLWFTGPPGAGKTTLSTLVAQAMTDLGISAERMESGEFRRVFWPELGFSEREREKNALALAHVCGLLNRHGIVAVVACVSPDNAVRARLRETLGEFVEVCLACDKQTRVERDPGGIYTRAQKGEVTGLAGWDREYQASRETELEIATDTEPPEESAKRILIWLDEMGYLEADAGGGYSEEDDRKVQKRLKELGYL